MSGKGQWRPPSGQAADGISRMLSELERIDGTLSDRDALDKDFAEKSCGWCGGRFHRNVAGSLCPDCRSVVHQARKKAIWIKNELFNALSLADGGGNPSRALEKVAKEWDELARMLEAAKTMSALRRKGDE